MAQAYMFNSTEFGAVCIQVRNTEGANTLWADPERAGIFRIYRVKMVADNLVFQAFPQSEQWSVCSKIYLEGATQRVYLERKLMQAKEQYCDTWFRLFDEGINPSDSHPDLKREDRNVEEIAQENDLIPKMLNVLGAFRAARNNDPLPMLNGANV